MTVKTAATLSVGSRLIQELYQLPMAVIHKPSDLTLFVDCYCLHRLQTCLSEKMLTQLIAEADRSELLFLTDIFTPQFILLFLDDTPVIVGPYCPFILQDRDARTLINRYKPEHLNEKRLLHYISSFPHISESDAVHIVYSLLHLMDPDKPARPIKKIPAQDLAGWEEDNSHKNREYDLDLLEKRYACEQHFLKDIAAGNFRAAIMDLRNMHMDVAYLKKIGTTLEQERMGAAITRTTVRLAAIQAGLPPFIVDRISSQNAITTRAAPTVEEILHAKEKMIREFCKAIQDHRSRQYSALTQSAIYYMEREYYQAISVHSLADSLEISENHLIACFRKEMGITPNTYLRTVRLKQAAILLKGTDLSVQEIASSVGISDSNYFIKCFRKEYGSTPLTYRKAFRV